MEYQTTSGVSPLVSSLSSLANVVSVAVLAKNINTFGSKSTAAGSGTTVAATSGDQANKPTPGTTGQKAAAAMALATGIVGTGLGGFQYYKTSSTTNEIEKLAIAQQ